MRAPDGQRPSAKEYAEGVLTLTVGPSESHSWASLSQLESQGTD